MIVTAPRASAILYNLLTCRPDPRPFLLPANICPVVPLTFLKAGRSFSFVDIDPATLEIDPRAVLAQARSGQVGGLLFAHPYGRSSAPFELFSDLKRIDPALMVIDDRCLCIPDGSPALENPADVLLYSSGYAKIVDLGSGGYAFLRKNIFYKKRSLPFSPSALDQSTQSYKTSIAGRQPYEYIDSAWLQLEPFPHWEELWQSIETALPASLAHRQELNRSYRDRLPQEICLPDDYQAWRFNLRLRDRDRLMTLLKPAGLFASSHYASLAGIFAPGRCPHAETLAGQVVNLFNDAHYTPEMAGQTCDIIRKVL